MSVLEVKPLRLPTRVVSMSILHFLEVESRKVVDKNLWKTYLAWEKSPRMKYEERTIVVYSLGKKDFFQTCGY